MQLEQENQLQEWLKSVARSVRKLNKKYIKSIVKKALEEDLKPYGDITTNLIKNKNKSVRALIISKQDGIISGLDFCKSAFLQTGKEAKFLKKFSDGSIVKKNNILAEVKAKTKTILKAERTALNFLNHASGISTLTNKFVSKVKNKSKICCTRKTAPNLRILEKYAVKKGGGYNHRYNLSDEVLIKENHIKCENLITLIKKAKKTRKVITVEIEKISQLKKILGLKFKRVLFDNMSINELKKCLKICKDKYETEFSGNVNIKNVKKISNTGVLRISVGAITHSAKYFNTSLLFR